MDRRQFVYTAGVCCSAFLSGPLLDDKKQDSSPEVDHEPVRGTPNESDSILFGITPEKLWSFETEDKVFATPIVANGYAYVGSKDGKLYAFGEKDSDEDIGEEEVRMFKINPENTNSVKNRGPKENVQKEWEFDSGGDIWGNPVIVDGRLYFGSENGTFYSVDAEDGKKRWEKKIGGAISPPALVDDTVYFSAVKISNMEDRNPKFEADNAGTVYALNPDDGSAKWSFKKDFRILSPPAVDGERIYVGCWDTNFYAIDAETGEEAWRFERANSLFCGTKAAVYDGVLYIGNHDHNVYAIDTNDGTLEWEFETGGKVVSSAVATEDGVFVGSLDGNLYGIDSKTGELLWSFEASGPVASSPGFRDGVLYVGSGGERIHAVNSNSGDSIWEYNVEGSVVSSPLVSKNTVYVGSNDKRVYSIENKLVKEDDLDGIDSEA